jgi:hypothetical protein
MKEIIKDWIIQTVNSNSIPDEIIAFNFGMYETEDGYCIYLIGSKHYDKDDDDWACDEDFVPTNNFLIIPFNDKKYDWDVFLNKIVDIISSLITTCPELSPLSSRYVTVGFDDGNLIRIKGSRCDIEFL